MPFAWTAIHLVDVITGASAADPHLSGDKEQAFNKDNVSQFFYKIFPLFLMKHCYNFC